MRYKPSIAFDRMSGSAKGVTASSNKGAIFIRSRGTGSKKRTADQATIKSIFRLLTQSWKNLNQAQIVAWNNAAKSQSGRRVLGQKAQLTGSNLYLRLNFWVVRCGHQPLTTPPELTGLPQPGQASLSLSAEQLMFHLLSVPQQQGLKLIIMATAPQSIGTITGVGRGSTFCSPLEPTTTAINLLQQYQAKYGIPNASKPKLFLRYFFVNPSTGEKGPEQLQTVILGQGSSVRFHLNLSAAVAEQGTVTPAGTNQYQDGTQVTIQATPANNYAFLRWSDGSTVNPRQLTIDRNLELQAEFVQDIHYTMSIDISPSGAGTVSGAGTYPAGRMAHLSPTAASGWQFDHWHDNDEPDPESADTEAANYSVHMTRDRSFTAVFTRIQANYHCIWDVNNSDWGHIEPDQGGNWYPHGEIVRLTAVPETDEFEFDHWSDGNTDNPRNILINKSRNLTAVFYSVYEETLHIEVEYGRCYEDGNAYRIGEQVQVEVIPRPGFHFRCWADDPDAGATRTILIQEDMPTLHAICESDDTYTVGTYAYPSRGGTVVGGGTGFHYGDVITITATPAAGYRFVRWEDDWSTNPVRTHTVEEDRDFEATFEEIPADEE